MYNRTSTYHSRALNYFHFFIAALTAVYFGVSFIVQPDNISMEAQNTQINVRYFILTIIAIDVILGVYIKVATNKAVLFFQSLAAMLLFAAHIFFIYAYFYFDGGIISPQSALETGIIILLFSCFLHLFNFWKAPVQDDVSKKLNVDDSIFEFREYEN